MKRQIMKYGIWLLLSLFILSCENNQPQTQAQGQLVPSTGNPAIDNISAKIVKQPGDATLYAARANEFYKNKGYDEAIADMASAMKIDSTNADYHHLLADIYLEYFQSRRALQTMERAAALHPKRVPTLLKLAMVQYILQQYDESMTTLKKALTIEPQNAEAFFIRSLNFVDKGEKKESIQNLRYAVDLDPDYVDAWMLLGQIYAQDKNPEAELYFENAIQVNPNDINSLQTKASYLHNNDKLDEAMDLYNKIIEIDSKYPAAYHSMGVIFLEKNALDKAYENFDLSVKVDPTFVTGYYYRGLAAESLGKFNDAKYDYQQAIGLNPKYQKAIDAMKRVDDILKQSNE